MHGHSGAGAGAGAQRIPVSEHQRSVRELLAAVMESPSGPGTEILPLGEARGRRLATDIRASIDVPPVPNSQMDGFAYRVADLPHSEGTAALTLGSLIAAGEAPGVLAPGEARPIMTGAPLPEGADAVVSVEDTAIGAFHQFVCGNTDGTSLPSALEFEVRPEHAQAGRFVRAAGSDTARGDRMAAAGDHLTPHLLGHLASAGIGRVEVNGPITVIVVSTGSELAQPGATPEPGHIYDSNSPAIAAALEEIGVRVARQLSVADDPHALYAQVSAAVTETGANIIVSSGGVSAGAVEPIRQIAELPDIPVRIAFDKVAMQPGGPQGLGILDADGAEAAWIALPGNPVSALLSVEMFLREPLGGRPRPRVRMPVRTLTGEPEASPAGLLQIRRARLTSESTARLVGGPSSHLLGALALSDALVLVDPSTTTINDRDEHEVMILR